jgi:pyrrolidone-carboxylate peptidase
MLLTGFESYGGRSLNPAEQVVKRLGGSEILISLPQVLSDAGMRRGRRSCRPLL